MNAPFRITWAVVLLYTCVSWDCCLGWIGMCWNDGDFTKSGTSVIAKLGENVCVSFCADTDYKAYNYITIQHSTIKGYWYPNNSPGRIEVIFVEKGRKGIINITIPDVQEEDFSDVFNVTMYVCNRHDESLKLWFKLAKESAATSTTATSTTTTSTTTVSSTKAALTEQSAETNETAIEASPEVATESTIATITTTTATITTTTEEATTTTEEATTETFSSSSVSTTDAGPRCLPQTNSGCPENWYPVHGQRCLRVFPRVHRVYPKAQCESLLGLLPNLSDVRDVIELKSCLEYLLQNTTVKVVHVWPNGDNINVQTGSIVSGDYLVACLVDKLQVGPPVLCQGQPESKVISINRNQTTSFSVCLMSDELPTWENKYRSKNISVVITKKSGSRIYFSAEISFFNMEDGDNETSQIIMSNQHGSLHYSVTLQPDKSARQVRNNPEHQSPSTEENNTLPIVLPLVLIAVLAGALIAFLVYKHKAKLQARRSSSMVRTLNSSDSGNDDGGQGCYANLKDLGVGNSGQQRPTTLEEEGKGDNCQENELSSYITEEDSGRFVSDEGLVYLTVVEAARKVKAKPKRAKQKPKPVEVETDDKVEYITLDFSKTGKIMISEEEEGTTEEHGGQEEAEKRTDE